MTRVIFEGREIGADDLKRSPKLRDARAPVTAAGAGLPDEDAAYVFTRHEEFDEWAADVGVADRVRNVRGHADKLLKTKDKFGEREEKELRERHRRAKASLEKLSKDTGEPVTSRKLLERWVRENSPDDKRPIDPFIAWDGLNHTGDWMFTAAVAPRLWDWNDRISSLTVVMAVAMFCEHDWFGGARLWLFGVPGYGIGDLSRWTMRYGQSWDNQISSFALFGW